MRPLFVLAVAAAIVVGGAQAATTVRFSTLQQEGFGPVLTTHFGNANLVIMDSIMGADLDGPFNWAGEKWAQTLNWNANFVISAAVAEPTTGYKLTIKRITLQHFGHGRTQFCVIAALAKPDPKAPVLQRRSWAVHVVRVSRRLFRSPPMVAVLRGTDGKLLARGYSTRPTSPVFSSIPPPAAELCRA